MTPTRTWLLAAFLFVSLLATHARAAEPPGLNDAAARDRLEEMERAGVLADPWWARAYWLRAETAPTEQARTADLRWALRFDPDFTRARRDLAFSLLRQRDGEFAEQLRLAVTRSLSSFPGQIRALLGVFAVAFGATLLATVALATLAVAKILPRVHHGLRERLLFLPAELRSGVALLTIALPLLVALTLPPTAAVFWALLFGLVGTWTRLDRGERRVGVVALVTLLATPIALSAWTRLGDPLLPGSYLYSLWDLQVGIDATATSNVDTNAPKSAEP
ncbi:MAG: hypothetical protein KC591_14395, partial [Gemmatimonadetes bacterium]|nr:hypothetical protein [Gemmatimonadota bacterium]